MQHDSHGCVFLVYVDLCDPAGLWGDMSAEGEARPRGGDQQRRHGVAGIFNRVHLEGRPCRAVLHQAHRGRLRAAAGELRPDA